MTLTTFNLAAHNAAFQTTNYALEPGFNASPQLNFGGAKLVARFAQLLLTVKGSDITDPAAGCTLVPMIARFHTSEKSYLVTEVNQILADVSFQMMSSNDPRVEPEARFLSAKVEDIVIDGTTVLLYFIIISEAQEMLQFKLPVPV